MARHLEPGFVPAHPQHLRRIGGPWKFDCAHIRFRQKPRLGEALEARVPRRRWGSTVVYCQKRHALQCGFNGRLPHSILDLANIMNSLTTKARSHIWRTNTGNISSTTEGNAAIEPELEISVGSGALRYIFITVNLPEETFCFFFFKWASESSKEQGAAFCCAPCVAGAVIWVCTSQLIISNNFGSALWTSELKLNKECWLADFVVEAKEICCVGAVALKITDFFLKINYFYSP